jgi:hypothetical protein
MALFNHSTPQARALPELDLEVHGPLLTATFALG